MTKRLDVITIGSAVRDLMFPTSHARIVQQPDHLIGFEYGSKIHSNDIHRFYGGGAANTAVCFSRLGVKVAACVCVGNDAEGNEMVKHLRSELVDTRYVQRDPKRGTGFSFLVVETKSNEHVAFVDYGANQGLTLPKALLQHPPEWFYVSALSATRWPQVIKQLQTTKAKLAWNPGAIQLAKPKLLKPLLRKTTVLNLNYDEAMSIVGKGNTTVLVKRLQAFGPKIAVVTDGRKGATIFDGEQIYKTAGSLLAPKDTTGAGDAFGASFVAGLIRYHGNIKKALQLATQNASAEVSQIGAQNGLLRWKEVR